MIKITAAMDKNGVVGIRGSGMPWPHNAFKDDMKQFRAMTIACGRVGMGRRTLTDDLKGLPLPNRTNIIFTRDPDFAAPGCIIRHNIGGASMLTSLEIERDIFIIGGAEIWALTLPWALELYLTRIHAEFKGDVFFPLHLVNFETDWRLAESQDFPQNERNMHAFTAEHWVRR